MNANAQKWSFHAIKHGVWYGSIQYTLHRRWTSSAYQSNGFIDQSTGKEIFCVLLKSINQNISYLVLLKQLENTC